MSPVEMLKSWFDRDFGRLAKWDTHVFALEPSSNSDGGTTYPFQIFTESNVYRMRVVDAPDRASLICEASSRTPLPGETWTRGLDIADGPLSEETWHKFVADVVMCELVRVSPSQSLDEIKRYTPTLTIVQ